MNDFHRNSQYPYCVKFEFNKEFIISYTFSSYSISKYGGSINGGPQERKYPLSMLYDIAEKKILKWGYDSEMIQSMENNETIFYIDNVFMKLHDIYLKKKKIDYKFDIHDTLVLQVVPKILQELVEISNNSYLAKDNPNAFSISNSRFTFCVPTIWDFGIREELMRPLFIKAGLIDKKDDKRRLLFFTKLESIFEHIQVKGYLRNERINLSLKNGKQYIMNELYFTENNMFVDLDLFSVHYSPTTAIDHNYVPKSLKSICFNISLDSKIDVGINSCLKNRGFDMESIKTKKLLDVLIDNYQNQEFDNSSIFKLDHNSGNEYEFFKNLYLYQPFKDLPCIKEYSINENEIYSIQLITVEEIHTDFFSSLKINFLHHLTTLVNNTDWKMRDLITQTIYLKSSNDKNYHYKLTTSFSWIVIFWLKSFLKIDCKSRFNFKHVLDDISSGPFFGDLMEFDSGQMYLTKKQIHSSIARTYPTIIHRDIVQDSEFSYMRMFIDSEPNYLINLDLSFKTINVSLALMGANHCVERTISYSECIIKPLGNFFIQSNMYRRPVLQITNRMKLFMESNFKEYIINKRRMSAQENILNLKTIKNENIDILKNVGIKIKKCIADHKMTEYFSASKNDELVLLWQLEYIYLFLMMYFGYIDELISFKLKDSFKNIFKEDNVGYVISVEKMLMDSVFGSNEDLEKLLLGSGMLQLENKYKKIRIITHGEEILPFIEQKIEFNLEIKSYFVLAQVHETYIHLTLKQVVKASTPEESSSAIVVQDEIIQIENVNDTLCSTFWNGTNLNNQITKCILHKDIESDDPDFNLLQNYKHISAKIKNYMLESFTATDKSLDLETSRDITINTDCSCSIHVSLRDIIENGLHPTLNNITTIITASLNGIFQEYIIDFVFYMENMFLLSKDSFMLVCYNNILQEAFENSMAMKKNNTKMFIVNEPVFQLMQPIMYKKPYMYNCFTTGSLYQVSKDTYVLYALEDPDEEFDFRDVGVHLLGHDPGVNELGGKEAAMIIIRKGQLLPRNGLIKQFKLYSKSGEYEDFFYFRPMLAKLIHSENSVIDDIVSLDKHSYENLSILQVPNRVRNTKSVVNLEMKYINHKSALEYELRLHGIKGDYPYEPNGSREEIMLAYF